MRYSMLVYITKMSRTLLEATQYLRSAPENNLRGEMVESGRQMLGQIRTVLEEHRNDLRSGIPLEQLAEIENLWANGTAALEDKLEQFIQTLPNEVSYQVRALFFAELGEKWDAMQSVYEHMRDDPRFDPVIVRTPVGRVVERNGKRKQEIIYKDFLKPMGIPSLGYDQYNIEEDCPELVFTSQPYESCTPSEFWPETIAKHARLVYLPYYLPDVPTAASVTSLAQLPVYRYAWKVVCPTERQYRYYCRHAENKGTNALLTGIPKTDPFVRLTQEPVQLPQAWGSLVGKTVFLWNSWYDIAVSSMRYFNDLLNWFEEHQDCGLIWRNHPMTDTVTKLYHPNQYTAYQKNLYRAEKTKNIVIDREISCCAAFSASNAMISDWSSLLPQYLLINKPAMWIDSHAFQFTGEQFIEGSWMERGETIDDIFAFMERVRNGEDRNAALRSMIQQRDLPLADGHCGERVCNALWSELHQEDLKGSTYG